MTNKSTTQSGIDRRTFLRRAAAGTVGTIGVIGAGSRLDHSPVGEAQAIAPAVAVGLAATAAYKGAAVGWAVREYEIVGSDAPPEGLTNDALINQAYQAARTRQSTNASSIVDNQNILEGIEHTAYADGKIAAIEALNQAETQSQVLESAQDGAADYEKMVIENLVKTWNESVEEFGVLYDALEDHPDSDVSDVFSVPASTSSSSTGSLSVHPDGNSMDYDYEYRDNIVVDVQKVDFYVEGSIIDGPKWYHLFDDDSMSDSSGDFSYDIDGHILAESQDEMEVEYLDAFKWEAILDDIETVFNDVYDGLETWVDGVYGDVQSGELDTEELLTPREMAEMQSDDEDFNQAIADLQALNVAVDLEREAEVYLPDINATLYGSIARTQDGMLETGTIDPDEKDGSFYLTYDISQGHGQWSAYDEDAGVDGGILTFTDEPFDETLFVISTVAGETVEATADDFDETESGDYEIDLSDDLENAITDVDSIEFYSESDETQYETILLQEEFEIVTFTDSDGEEYESAEYTRSEPQTDDNYITEEEWQAQEDRYNELIEQYEDAQSGGDIAFPSFQTDDIEDLLSDSIYGIPIIGWLIGATGLGLYIDSR